MTQHKNRVQNSEFPKIYYYLQNPTNRVPFHSAPCPGFDASLNFAGNTRHFSEDPMPLNVVRLSEAPPLTDIVAHLRNLADQIEAGAHGEVDAVFAVIPSEDGWPHVFAWGNVAGVQDPIIQFELAKMWLLNNLVERS
jgi:hypothetical protein